MTLDIRKASKEDCEIIADLTSALNISEGMTDYHRPNTEILRKNFDKVDFYLAEIDRQPAGFVAGYTHLNPNTGFFRYVITSLYVDEDFRNKGIAKSLLKHVIFDKKHRDTTQFAIDVRPSNHAARRLYENLGFEKGQTSFCNYRLGFEKLVRFYDNHRADF